MILLLREAAESGRFPFSFFALQIYQYDLLFISDYRYGFIKENTRW